VRLLVLVLSGGLKPVYYVQRAFWRVLAERVQPLGVQVYLISTAPGIDAPVMDKETIHFPENSTADAADTYNYYRYASSSVDRYIEMMSYVYDKRPPGHDAPYVMRSTLASFWCFSRLLRWLDGMPRTNFGAGVHGLMEDGTQFLSGAGFVLSADVAHSLVRHSNQLNRTQFDDVAIGHQLRKMGVHTFPMARIDEYAKPIDVLPTSFANESNALQWRVKSAHAGGRGSVQDAAVWASLFFYHYGPTMEMGHGAGVDPHKMCA
jgi:hypothetical protein